MSGPLLVVGEPSGRGGRAMARRRRRRPPRRRVVAVVALAAGSLAAASAAGWWLLTSPTFDVARVESGPYRYTAEPDLRAALRRCLGRNIWTLSADDVRAELADLPWVRRVEVHRRLPATLAVVFDEWRPVLALPAGRPGGPPRLLLDSGRVLDLPDDLDQPGLPLLVDAALEPRPDGDWRLAAPEAASVVALTEALAATGFESAAPVDFVLCRPEGFEVVLQAGQGRLRVGREQYRERFERFLLTRSHVPAGACVDLRFRDRVSFLPAAALAADSAIATFDTAAAGFVPAVAGERP